MVSFDADDVVLEREAMAAIAKALETLGQHSARQRVLRWAALTFNVELASASPVPDAAGAPFVEQQTAALNLNAERAAAEQVRGKEPVDELFRELAADFQRLALERNGA